MNMEYFVFASNDCNLGCGYCSVLNDQKKNLYPKTPSYNIFSLKYFIENIEKKANSNEIKIIFFGGEPTVNLDFVYAVIDGIGNKITGKQVIYMLHTNGLILNKIKNSYLDKIKTVIVSINYEMIPKDKLFKSYFSKVIDNVRLVKNNHNIDFIGRLTITENVSLYTNVLQISNFFDLVYWQIQNCHVFNDFDKFYDNYKYELELLWEYWFSYFKRGFLIQLTPFTSLIQLLINKNEDRKNLCGYNSYSIYIQTNGECYSCPEEIFNNNFNIGSINSGINFNKPNNHIEQCNACEFLKLCYGRCDKMHLLYPREQIEKYCFLNKVLFNKIIENKSLIFELIHKNPQLKDKINSELYEITEYVP